MEFEFATAARIIFAPGSLKKIGPLAADLGKHALVVLGSQLERGEKLLELLTSAGIHARTFQVEGEPDIDLVGEGLRLARSERCELVIGMGGGSVMDVGKAIAILLNNPGEVSDYLEVVGRGQALTNTSVPCIAIPTTAGTGAEVTRNAVLGVPSRKVKVSMRSPFMLPRLALVDPELTLSLPPMITASTGLDALTQLIEPFVSNRANPLTSSLCREGMQRVARSLYRAYLEPNDFQARQDMSLASLFGGLALANSGLGIVHGFAGVLGGLLSASHGAICASLLPFAMESNVRALHQRQPDSPALERYHEIAVLLTGEGDATISQGIEWIQNLCRALNVPPLSALGLSREEFPQVVEKASKASSTRPNPIQLTSDEMTGILAAAF